LLRKQSELLLKPAVFLIYRCESNCDYAQQQRRRWEQVPRVIAHNANNALVYRLVDPQGGINHTLLVVKLEVAARNHTQPLASSLVSVWLLALTLKLSECHRTSPISFM